MDFRRGLVPGDKQEPNLAFQWLTNFDPGHNPDVINGTIDNDRLLREANDDDLDLSLFDGIMDSLTSASIRTYLSDYQFKGFDLVSIKLSFMKKAVAAYPNLRSSDSTEKLRAMTHVRHDIAKIVAFCINRSMNIEKLDSLGPIKDEFMSIIRKYSLKSHLDASEKGDGLSPQRICILSGALFHKMFLLSNNVYKFGRVEGLDPMFHNSIAPAYIPRTSWGLEQMKLWSVWCLRFSEQINSNKTGAEKLNLLKTTGNIAKIQFEQGLAEQDRLSYLFTFYERMSASEIGKFTLITSVFATHGLLPCSVTLKGLNPGLTQFVDKAVRNITRVQTQLAAQQQAAGPVPAIPVVPIVGGDGGDGGN